MDEEKNRQDNKQDNRPDNRPDEAENGEVSGNTSELLTGFDLDSIDYNFSVDDILAEFGIERTASEEESEPEPEPEPTEEERLASVFDEISATMEQERLEATIREVEQERRAEEARNAAGAAGKSGESDESGKPDASASDNASAPDDESSALSYFSQEAVNIVDDSEDDDEAKIREIEQNVERAADELPTVEVPGATGRIHVFEEIEQDSGEETGKKRRRNRRRRGDEDGEARKVVIKEASTAGHMFSDDLGGLFGDKSNEGLEEARMDGGVTERDTFGDEDEDAAPRRRFFKKRRSRRDQYELEAEMFSAEDSGNRREPEEAEQNIPAEDRLKEIVESNGSAKLRTAGAMLLTLALCFLTLAPKLGLTLPQGISYIYHPFRYLFINLAAIASVMMLCYEVVVVGLRDLVTLKPNMESVVTVSCVSTVLHILTVMLFPSWEGYLPFTAVSSLSLVTLALCRRKWLAACVRSYRTVSGMTRPYIVCNEPDYYEGEDAVAKYKAQKSLYFVNQTERADLVRRVWRVLAPIVIAASLVFAAVSAVGRGEPQRFCWCFSVMAAASAPFSLALPYWLPFAKVIRRLSTMGEVIAGWSAADELGAAREVVVTDSDIFPRGSISLNGLKVFGNFRVDQIITYSASLISASGAGIARVFEDLLRDQAGTLRKVSSFKFYENGGIGGEIEGRSVLAGTASFMARTGIRVPRDVSGKTMIFVAINLELAGIFAVNYTASKAVRDGFRTLERHGITPVFAVRDFNITPSMIEAKFKLSTDTVDFPQISQRLALSDPDRLFTAKPLAVLNREGLGHYAESIAAARNLRRTTKLCLILSIICLVIAMLVMFYLTYIHAPATASPSNLLIYMVLWLLPAWLATNWVNV